MVTWIVGDIHGCADELAALVERLQIGRTDRLIACGDLLHRGPDPLGVVDILQDVSAQFVLGNHEHAVLARFGLAPSGVEGVGVPASTALPEPTVDDLRGDGAQPLQIERREARRVLAFLTRHSGHLLTNSRIEGAGTTPDGRSWWLVHAGVVPGLPAERQPPELCMRLRRTAGRGRPYWFETWEGPELVLFGHTPSAVPRIRRWKGRLVALGLDTGCVYGGRLTAYSPELDEVHSVAAARSYASVA